jgi:hypothetical protein
MKVKPLTIVVEVLVPESKAQSIESWNEDFSIESHVASIIKDHVQERGYFCKAEAFPVVAYDELCQTTLRFMENNALADIEDEILNKACIGGNCED